MFKGVTAALNQASSQLQQAASQTALSAELAMANSQMSEVKSRWGREVFDKFVAGDQAAVTALTERAQQEIAALQQKIASIEARKGVAGQSSGQTQVTVQVPQGMTPGSYLCSFLPLARPADVGPETQQHISKSHWWQACSFR